MNRGIKYFLMSAGGVLFCVVAVSSYSAGYLRDAGGLDCGWAPGIFNCKYSFNKHEDSMDAVDLTLAAIDVIDSGGESAEFFQQLLRADVINGGEKSEKVFQQSLRAIEANLASIAGVVNKWDSRGAGKITMAQILYMHRIHDGTFNHLCKTAPVLRDHYQRGLIFRESDKLKRTDYPGVSMMNFLDESCPRQMEPETLSDIDASYDDWRVWKEVLSLTDILLYMMLLILSLLVMRRVSSVQALLSRILLISLLFCTISVAIDYASYFLMFPYFEATEKIGPFVPKLDIGLLLSSACGSSVIGFLFYLKNKVSSPLAI